MENIKAIETEYDGYRFRSRLEARWAVFLNTCGIRYEYEMEGFEMNGEKYLPDFYLPDANRWLEIKGSKLSKREMDKIVAFCEAMEDEGVKFSILIGPPELSVIGAGVNAWSWEWKKGKNSSTTLINAETGESMDAHSVFGFDKLLYTNKYLTVEPYPSRFIPTVWLDGEISKSTYQKAIKNAKSARFEHGEKPSAR